MNLGSITSHPSNHFDSAHHDLNKLIDICNSYGLDHQETSQLISEFKRGALYQSTHSQQPSLDESLNQMTFSQKNEEEEYSFKHPREPPSEPREQCQHHDWIDAHTHTQMAESSLLNNPSLQHLQQLLQKQQGAQQDKVAVLQEQNKGLKESLRQQDSKINDLLQMKKQDTQIIMGLKDVISSLSLSIQQKECSYQELTGKYSNLVQTRVKELSSVKSSTNIEDSQLTDVTNVVPPRRNSFKKQGKERVEIQYAAKEGDSGVRSRQGSRVDIRKYKEMIENMRNNY